MTPPWPFSSLSARFFFMICFFESRLDLDSTTILSTSLSKIFFTILGVGRPCGEYGEKPALSYDTSLIEYHLQDHEQY